MSSTRQIKPRIKGLQTPARVYSRASTTSNLISFLSIDSDNIPALSLPIIEEDDIQRQDAQILLEKIIHGIIENNLTEVQKSTFIRVMNGDTYTYIASLEGVSHAAIRNRICGKTGSGGMIGSVKKELARISVSTASVQEALVQLNLWDDIASSMALGVKRKRSGITYYLKIGKRKEIAVGTVSNDIVDKPGTAEMLQDLISGKTIDEIRETWDLQAPQLFKRKTL